MAVLDLSELEKNVVCDDFNFKEPQVDPVELAKNLSETMISNKCLSLSAPQVGINLRAFVINCEKIIACFNPIFVDKSTEEVYINEACASHPGLIVKIKRSRFIKVRYSLPNGDRTTQKFDGLTARLFQHEFDHLYGQSHLPLANFYHRNKALKDQKIFNKILDRNSK